MKKKFLIQAVAVIVMGITAETFSARPAAAAARLDDCGVCVTQCSNPSEECEEFGCSSGGAACYFESCETEGGDWYGIYIPCNAF